MEVIHRILRNYGAVFRLVFKFSVFSNVDKLLTNKCLTSFNLPVANLLQCSEVCFPVTGDTNKFKIVVETYWVHHTVFYCKRRSNFHFHCVNQLANRRCFKIQHSISYDSVKHVDYTEVSIKGIMEFEKLVGASISESVNNSFLHVFESVDSTLIFIRRARNHSSFIIIQKHNASF